MEDHNHRHRHHRPHLISVPPRNAAIASRPYPLYSFPPSTPTPTPSKSRGFSLLTPASRPSATTGRSSLSFLFLLLFSLRSLYSLLPFLRSSPPSFSLFPFSFLVSLLSFLLSLSFSLFSPPSSSKSMLQSKLQNQPLLVLTSLSPSQNKVLALKSVLLAVVFLLRFQALRYCGAAAMILAELSGNVAARFLAEVRMRDVGYLGKNRSSRFRGFIALFLGLLLLALSWDRNTCFPFSGSSSSASVDKWRFSIFPRENCVRVWPMLLPFLSGFLGCYERVSMNRGVLKELGQKRVRLISLLYTSIALFVPAVISILVFEHEGDSISVTGLGWPLANTVVFGVLLSENCSDEKFVSSKDFRREFLVTFACTVVLELFYFPELSLWGLLLCGTLLYVAVAELDPFYSSYAELGLESSEPFTTSIIKPIRHILSERKSRKIALFLLINTGYMVVEFAVGFMSNSLGLISDACHMLFDCAALAIGLYASYISRLPANGQFNYGRGRFEVLSGYVNAVFLVLVGALIVLESIERILDPQEISTSSLLVVSIGGLLVNVIGLIFFHEEHHHAHGGTCSHSDSHSGSHSHSHSEHQHDHDCHIEDQKWTSVDHDCHENSCSGHHNEHGHRHSDHHSNDNAKSSYPTLGSSSCHGHDHADNHSEGSHGCDHAHHNDHDHGHGHGHGHGHHHHDSVFTSHDSTLGHGDGCPPTQTAAPHTHGHCSSIGHTHQRNLPSSEGEAKEHSHHHIDHNMEGIFLHVLADTMGSVGVVVSTLLIKYKGWLVADPASSIFISILIVSSVIPLLRNSAEILLQRVPRVREQDLFNALNNVTKIKQVRGIPHFHAWSFTNAEVVGTIHLHVEMESDKASAKAQVSRMLHDVGINDLTLQMECVKHT